jgi:hypothetical protein
MNNIAKHIFIFICIFSLFSMTMQATVMNTLKDNKVFKTQGQQNPVTEEEEETHDKDESAEKEVLYLAAHTCSVLSQNLLPLTWATLEVNYPLLAKTILIPPPKY